MAFVIAIAALLFAAIGHVDRATAAEPPGRAASCQLSAPAPAQPDVPAVLTAADSSSATVQRLIVIEATRRPSPVLDAFAVGPHLPLIGHDTSKPRFFPLLI